jgi:hypothetical protein
MTDRNGQSTEDAAPESHDEAVENVRAESALSGDTPHDAATDDDARTPDTAQAGENREG